MRRAPCRAALLLFVFALFSIPALAAGGRPEVFGKKPAPGFVAAGWELFRILTSGLDKARGTMDPDGQPGPAPSPASESDAWGTMDPDGSA